MTRPQPGIFAEGTNAHHHIELQLSPGVTDAAIISAIEHTRAANAVRRTNGGVAVVIGLGPDLAARLLGDQIPPLSPFGGYQSPNATHRAPATQRDLWIWVHGPQRDGLVDVMRRIVAAWETVATVELDVSGFMYQDSRDLTGFVDGTANLALEQAPAATLIAAKSPGAGGCCAMTMKFTHDLVAFEAQSVPDQERVFGRTKAQDHELKGDDKPADAHIARVEVDDDAGNELVVYRRSIPWANATSQGLQFVSFGPDLDRFDQQLQRMYGMDGDGCNDRLLAFTVANSGSFWFCPSVDQLESVGS